MRLSTLTSALLLLGATLTTGAFANPGSPAEATKTVANLRAAYLGETTAHAKYAVYARAADRAGYKEVAQLFRAASGAEETHARNHRQSLAKLGVTDPKAGTTDALKGESYERDTMYPVMIRQAKSEGQTDAERSMNYALSAEKQHAELYKAALKSLSNKPSPEGFYVCPVCGATYTTHNVPAVSPVCGTPKAQFKMVK